MGVELRVEESDDVLRARCARRVGIAPERILHLRVAHRALDARRRGRRHDLRFVHHVDLTLAPDESAAEGDGVARALRTGILRELPAPVRFERDDVTSGARDRRVAVVGAGPGGLYAAWTLAVNGVAVDVFDRGPSLRERGRAVARFIRTRELDSERNLLFGEGGAGTYSDGKLYTRTRHALEEPILETLVEAGADPSIAFDARSHVGTDRLHRVLPKLRERLESMGVAFHFETRLEGLSRAMDGRVTAIETSAGRFDCDGVVLAVGHSARDTLRALHGEGLPLEAKPFQLGLRVEHPQAVVDAGRFGPEPDLAKLGHAYYSLVAKSAAGRAAVHSFCMCPGGQIVAAVAQPGLLCTNGMSNSRHSSPFANSGLVVTLGPREFGTGVFAGVEYQESLEARFFEAGGGDYTVPAQRVDDFVAGRASRALPRSSYKLGQAATRIDRLLPEAITEALRAGIAQFDRQLPGYAGDAGLLVGVESRSSGPLRIPRDRRTRSAPGFPNLWPVGEGAGYAGGIMSAAIDGARSAWAVLGVAEG
ncbi:MAG: FAD-dependent oxidoreductase [Deltaproteobacteria bacterium]|nr:FAD-dependent oxidoreductase [Deltaproteobacteria bacterium]